MPQRQVILGSAPKGRDPIAQGEALVVDTSPYPFTAKRLHIKAQGKRSAALGRNFE
jgi:hypothetical protein